MATKDVELLMDKWINDPGFRSAVRRDPEAAVREAGVNLSEDERSALNAFDWSLSDDELATRASRMM